MINFTLTRISKCISIYDESVCVSVCVEGVVCHKSKLAIFSQHYSTVNKNSFVSKHAGISFQRLT